MTEPIHIDEAIEVEQVALDYYSNLADMEVAEAETAGWVNALQAVNSGKVFTDDTLRADRMTRTLAELNPCSFEGHTSHKEMWGCDTCGNHWAHRDGQWHIDDHADDCAWTEARRWVEANPEVRG